MQGAGTALAVPAALAVVRTAFPGEDERTRAVGLWAALGGSLALAVGPVVGGIIVEHWGWRAIFLINLPVGAVSCALARRASGVRGGRRAVDLPGQVLAVAGMSALAFALVEAGTLGWSTVPVAASLAAFALGLVAFLFIGAADRRADAAARSVPQRRVLHRDGGGHARQRRRLRPDFRTEPVLPARLDTFTRGGRAGVPAADHQSRRQQPRLGAWPRDGARARGGRRGMRRRDHGLRWHRGCSRAALVSGDLLPLLVAGAGVGLVVPAVTAAMLSAVDPARAGIAAGGFNTFRQTGGLVGVAVMGLLGGTGQTLASIQACLLAAVAALVAAAAATSSGRPGRTRGS